MTYLLSNIVTFHFCVCFIFGVNFQIKLHAILKKIQNETAYFLSTMRC